jgi:hypothetical protein
VPTNPLLEPRENHREAALAIDLTDEAVDPRWTPVEEEPAARARRMRFDVMRRSRRGNGAVRVSTMILALVWFAAGAVAQSADPLKDSFQDPPATARPLVWWHWMNGNISMEGIKLDLDWMHRIGIAGFQNFDAALSTPQVVEKRLVYMTPEWKEAFKYAITLGDKSGMEMGIAGSPGWSESGGPWVPASHGMKKYVWSETIVEGGKPFTGKVAAPPAVTGPFQNIALAPSEQAGSMQFYADAAVVAFRLPPDSSGENSVKPRITSSGGEIDGSMLNDGDLTKTVSVPIPATDSVSWIQFAYPSPETIRSVSYVMPDPGELEASMTGITAPEKTLEAGDDGKNFRKVVTLAGSGAPAHTISFVPVTARFFRVTFKATPRPPVPGWAVGSDPASFGIDPLNPPKAYRVAELVLRTEARVNRFEEKAAFVPDGDIYRYATPAVDSPDAIERSRVVDLTSKMQPDGALEWTPPAGRWMIVRLGYSLLGITNHPATPEATGLEVDKLDHRFVQEYFEKYLDSYKDAVGAGLLGKRGIRYVINDSWEAGSQNWTDNMPADFKRLRGYDLTPWLPVLTGRIVESAAASDRFLWDFRKTIADLIADEHYGELEKTLHKYGMGHYAESHEGGRAFVADGMEVKKFSEVPMSAMWTQSPGQNKTQFAADADCRESASVAHIYGQNIAAAESMTASGAAAWAWSPATLKPTADAELLAGINRFVIHESTHQPLVGKAPGLTLGPFGQWFNRNETWAEQARPWVDYLARSSYLLQQGRFAADVVYFYGEDSNLTAVFDGSAPDIPPGYNFDYINADGLVHELGVVNGMVVTKSGMQYRVLGLDPHAQQMSLPVLRAIQRLVQDGAVVAGPKPAEDPSLADDQDEFRKLSSELFGDGSGVHQTGKGTVFAGQTLAAVFRELHVPPDFTYARQGSAAEVRFVHRTLPDGDIYFLDNRSDREESIEAAFRVTGRQPELWYAETGITELVSFAMGNGCSTVPLHLEPWGTVFVVFRKATTATSLVIPSARKTTLTRIEGPWIVSFERDRGAPASLAMNELSAWNQNADPGVKYFSGIGTYTKTLQAPAEWFKESAGLWLDLGDVKNLAAVTVNGTAVGVTWHAPYCVEVTSALKPGANEIRISVANAWVNRLIGDEQPGATRIAFADVKPYKADSPLLPSGLLGPVTVLRADYSK